MTTEQPTRPGWHWFKYNADELPECVMVYEFDDELWFASLYCPAGRRCRSLSHAEWDGPLHHDFDTTYDDTATCDACGAVSSCDEWTINKWRCPRCMRVPGDEG